MVKALSDPATSSQDEVKKQRKKQAKREAKMMLKLEAARARVQKAERKFTKAQERLEARSKQLLTLESELAEIRSAHQQSEDEAHDAGSDNQTGQMEGMMAADSVAWQETSSHSNPTTDAEESNTSSVEGGTGDKEVGVSGEVMEPFVPTETGETGEQQETPVKGSRRSRRGTHSNGDTQES